MSATSPPRRVAGIALALAAFVLALAVWLAPRASEAADAAAEAGMRNAIAGVLERAPNAHYGVYVQNLNTGAVVFSHNANQSFVPASNLKLVTSAVALRTLGPDHRFATGLYFDGRTEGATLRGDLIIRGSGDPTFGSALSGGDPLAAWARELQRMGVERIEGRIIGDDTVMDDAPYAPGWDIEHIATSAWAAAAGGLTYSDNTVAVQIAGTRAGQDATVTALPEGYVNLQSSLQTRRGTGYGPLRIDRNVGTNDITVDGAISAGYRGTAQLPIHDPTMFALASFAERLRRAGIAVEAQLLDADDLGEAPSYGTDPLFVYHSPPVLDILQTINFRSNNLYAEQVFRATSTNGTLRGASQRAVSFMQTAGASTSGFAMRDGSGLSRKNLIAPEALGQMLAYMYRSEHREAYLSTIPRGGQDGSTLRYRLGGVPVWAKTGTVEHVRGLSGYVVGPGNTPYTFVVFVNNHTASSAAVGLVQNGIVEAIARGGG